ncbi:MAG TPA: hypothetical protein VEC37_01030, partial [Bacillota bacterium]|nr:hypothetical protein [Bacillota bacterium]
FGCDTTRAITVEYLPGSKEHNWVKNLLKQDPQKYRPTIAVNHFSNDRETDEIIGGVFSRSGKQVETLVSSEKPVDILEKALTKYLEQAGFKVITTSGWDLKPETIPSYLNTDFILGGRLKAFWVESRSDFFNSTIDSKVIFNLIIADTRSRTIIWTGQISGSDTKKSLAHTNDFFWLDLQNSINKSLSEAVNLVLQDEQAQKGLIPLLRVKF